MISFVDTCGAFPTFEAERFGQSEAIATCLTKMAALTVPIVTVVLGEGGSGGALAIAMGNVIGMMEHAYYSVISPEGAASILGRYKNEKEKKENFTRDCHKLAKMQKIFAKDLLKLDIIDVVLSEVEGSEAQTQAQQSINDFLVRSLASLSLEKNLVSHRYRRFRKIGTFETLTKEQLKLRLNNVVDVPNKREKKAEVEIPKEILFAIDKTLNSETSCYCKGRRCQYKGGWQSCNGSWQHSSCF